MSDEASTTEVVPETPHTTEGSSEMTAPMPEALEAQPPPRDIPPEQTAQTESQTAQIPVNEPFATEMPEIQPEPSKSDVVVPPVPPPLVLPPTENKARNLWSKAKYAIQMRRRKKLDRIMKMFETETSITNDKVEKLLHVSDATATRYLNILEKEGKIKQSGITGRNVTYTKI